MKRRIIGIDVGKNGGIVVYDTENNKLLEYQNATNSQRLIRFSLHIQRK